MEQQCRLSNLDTRQGFELTITHEGTVFRLAQHSLQSDMGTYAVIC